VREWRTVLAEGLGLPKLSGRGTFLAVLLVDSLGTGLFAPFSLLYFHDGVGLPLATVGLALSAAAAFALPVAPLAGALVDRLGARRVVAAAQLLQGAGFLGCLVVDGAAALFVAALVVRVGQRAFWSSILTLFAEIATPNERTVGTGSPAPRRTRARALAGCSREPRWRREATPDTSSWSPRTP
jgi:MFS family permease